MNLLFVTGTRIGDAVLSSGLLAHFVERAQGPSVTVACGVPAASLFVAVPGLERIIAVVKRKGGGHWLALWSAVVARRWDVVIDLRGSALAWLLFARRRFVLRPDRDLRHRVRHYGDLVGLDPPPEPRLWTLPAHEEAAQRLLPGKAPVLALGPTANWRGKTWRAERFAELGRRLVGEGGPLAGGRIAVFGAASERRDAEAVISALPGDRVIDLVGKVDLLTAYACLKRVALFVGNDSGLMHIAAAAGAPTLGLFGPSRDELYAPWGARAAVARTPQSFAELIGGPGYDHRTTDTLMDGLTVEKAQAAAETLYRRCHAGPDAGGRL
jgi:ADP-heptose:LPS heptosyltransferase